MDQTEDEALDTLQALLKASEYIKAFDIARRAVAAHPDNLRLRHGGVLALARMGATRRAKLLFAEWGLDEVSDDEDVLALWARLLKDEAGLTAGAERASALRRAAAAYEEAYHKAGGGYFPAINVASLLALAGQTDAADWARKARRTAEREDSYYAFATIAEANLVEAEPGAAAEALAQAVRAPGANMAAMSTTRRQLGALVAARGYDPHLLDVLEPPAVAHFCGHIVRPEGRFPHTELERATRDITALMEAENIGFAAGSLAAGADILLAEAVLARGGELDVVLPFGKEEFIDVSVRPSGESWVERFETCIARAKDVHFVTEDAYLGHDQLFNYASHYAIGLARLRADMLGARLCQIAIWDGEPNHPNDAAGTAIDLGRGLALGLEQHLVPSREGLVLGRPGRVAQIRTRDQGRAPRALMFGDLKGFSKLTDAQLPSYVDAVLGTCARVLRRHADRLTFRNTWGDGLFLVFDDLATAAECAFDLQAELHAVDFEAAGLPETLGLRLGMHYGPVFEMEDPVLRRNNCFGYHVSRAARVEPITPEGEVYVTEAAAAAMVVDAPDRFRCDYVGELPLAKGYGAFPMYALSRMGETHA